MSAFVADPAYALQLAIMARLLADPDLIAFFSGPPRVHDTIPADSAGKVKAVFPFISIGDVQVLEDEVACAEGSETHFMLHVWGRPPTARKDVATMAGLVRQALRRKLDVPGHRVVVQGFEHSLFKRDPDGFTRQGVMTFEFLTEPF